MATEERERTLEAWATAWSSGDPERVVLLFTDDCVYMDATLGIVNRGKTELRAFADGIFAAFPDYKVVLTSRFAAGDRAAMEWTMSGTHQSDLSCLAATGKRFSLRGSTIVELQREKIKRCTDYWDMVTFLKQIGAMPSE